MIMDILEEIKDRILQILQNSRYEETKDLYNDSLEVIKYFQKVVEDVLKKHSIEYEVEYIVPVLQPSNVLDYPELNKYLVATIRFILKNLKFNKDVELLDTHNIYAGYIVSAYGDILDINLLCGYGNVKNQYVLKADTKN